jgi:deoxyribose-phosphate aldolase
MVVNIGKVLSGEWNYVADDIAAVVRVAHAANAKVKVIFENAYLKDEHKKDALPICGEVRADWVKTSTGYAETGATIEDLKLMREHSPAWVQVKAAGGVRTFEKLMEVRAIGVTRVGATATKRSSTTRRRSWGGEPNRFTSCRRGSVTEHRCDSSPLALPECRVPFRFRRNGPTV